MAGLLIVAAIFHQHLQFTIQACNLGRPAIADLVGTTAPSRRFACEKMWKPCWRPGKVLPLADPTLTVAKNWPCLAKNQRLKKYVFQITRKKNQKTSFNLKKKLRKQLKPRILVVLLAVFSSFSWGKKTILQGKKQLAKQLTKQLAKQLAKQLKLRVLAVLLAVLLAVS